ncbi:MAG: isoprenyl transferase [Flavobacteriales bacterium]|nr:isoprenyl transferase [Flavobacteriales bacterium]MCX7769412.1 isoprenyl transferase [Flavobacteriales bacterium]MDW8410972.1 isoprenyl transferase [Flavobacteriales bacterium]
MTAKDSLDPRRIPRHIAIIMDGNGRWARQRGLKRHMGHRKGVDAVRRAVEACAEIGVEYLTVFAFSTENWQRPASEVNALMDLMVRTLNSEMDSLQRNGVRLSAFGDLDSLPSRTRTRLFQAIEDTRHNTRITLSLALSYSARWEILQAVQKLAADVEGGRLHPKDITHTVFRQYLATYPLPDPELLIRTSGEQRISNFLLWQIAYTELYFTPVLWPDFTKEHLFEAVAEFQRRQRRFGLTDEQLRQGVSPAITVDTAIKSP